MIQGGGRGGGGRETKLLPFLCSLQHNPALLQQVLLNGGTERKKGEG